MNILFLMKVITIIYYPSKICVMTTIFSINKTSKTPQNVINHRRPSIFHKIKEIIA